jgi:Uncharacterized conserved protein
MSFCTVCHKSEESCLCPYIQKFDPGIKFVLLMHPKEARQMRTGTGRIVTLSLQDSEIIIDVDFTANKRLNELLSDESYLPLLLYPGENAYTAGELPCEKTEGRKLLIIVIDGTWAQAKKMFRLSDNLKTLPRISFRAGYRSTFRFKKEPMEECLSTVESCYYLLKELKDAGWTNTALDPEPLMNAFDHMVDFQIECETLRHDLAGYDRDTERMSLKELRQLKAERDSKNLSI